MNNEFKATNEEKECYINNIIEKLDDARNKCIDAINDIEHCNYGNTSVITKRINYLICNALDNATKLKKYS